MGQSKGIGQKILNLDRTIIYFVALVLIIWPLVAPIGLPMPINWATLQTYDYINSFPEGSVAVIECSFDTSYMGSMQPALTAILMHLMERNWKLVVYSLEAEGPITWSISYNKVPKDLRDKYKYGVDYVNLGFMSGDESACMKFAENIKGLYSTDYYGTPVADIPMLKNINSYLDYDIIVYAVRTADDVPFRIWVGTFHKPLVKIASYALPPVDFFQGGLIKGFVRGTIGAAEYEKLLNRPGLELAQIDAISLFFLFLIFVVILGNIGYFLRKREARSI